MMLILSSDQSPDKDLITLLHKVFHTKESKTKEEIGLLEMTIPVFIKEFEKLLKSKEYGGGGDSKEWKFDIYGNVFINHDFY